MKFRRALASAAVAAALAPAALLTVTPAFADGAPTATTEPPQSPSPGASPSASASATATATVSPSDTPTTAPASTPATTPTTTPTTTPPSQSPTPTADPTNGTNCTFPDDPQIDGNLTSALKGLPAKIAAGSGWHAFTLGVANSSATDYSRVDLGMFAILLSTTTADDATGHLKLQYQDGADGSWHSISLDDDDPDAGYLGYTEVKPHASVDIKLRLSVDASAPAGIGFTLAVGIYADSQGNCVVFGGDGYVFRVTPVGSNPGGGDAQPATGGQQPIPPKPAGNTAVNPDADLAETGSSSATPVIAAVGGAVLLLGAGTVVALRRRDRTTGVTG